MAEKLSITDIAKLADVSVSTVSRALQDSPLISEKTKQKVVKIASQNNFKLNLRARNFRTQKSHIVGVFINQNHLERQRSSDQFLFSLLNHIATNLSDNNYDLLLHTTTQFTSDLAYNYFHNQKVDGVIVIGQGDRQHKELKKLSKTDVPFVVWGGYADDVYTTVGSDNVRGGYLATKHLIEQCGKSHLFFLGSPSHHEIKLRYQGFKQALSEHQLRSPLQLDTHTAFCIESGFEATQNIIESKQPFDGIVCASDTIALGAMECLKENGLSVPEEVAVIGYDDIAIAKNWSPSLSTIKQDTQEGGKLLVENVLNRINQAEIHSTQMTAHLIQRDSA